MRLVIFLLKCVVGLLASLGFVIVAAAAALAIWTDGAAPWAADRPEVPEHSVLSLDLSAGIMEARPDSALAQLSLSDALTMRELVEALEAAGEDERIQGLVARLGVGELGIAQVQELRQAIGAFRERGKFAVAFAESFGEGGDATLHFYLASAFDEIWLQPSGSFDVTGLALETPFLREALDELGVVPRLAQREEYKGAMNTFTDRDLPTPVRENLERLVQSWLAQIVRDVAADRAQEEDAVRAAIDGAPHPAAAALERGLVDRLGYWDEVSETVLAEAGEDADFLPLASYVEAYQPLAATGPTVALIYGLGPVVLAGGEDQSPFAEGFMASDAIAEAIASAVQDPEIAAIVLRVDSPGGSYVASDVIWREVQLAREADKPLIVSMGNVAASGGYFLAAPAHKIVALPGTVTGSIGVVSGKFVLSGLWDKLGVNWESVEAGRSAGFWSMNRDFSAAEWKQLQASLDRVYADFTGKVAAGRDMTSEAVAAVAKGQVWTGADARERGLVDELGGLATALALAAEAAGAPGERPQVRLLPKPRDPFQALLEDFFTGQIRLAETRGLLRDLARMAAAFRPLLEALDAPGAADGPRLRAPDLSPPDFALPDLAAPDR
jgi:protease-4